MQSRRWMMMVAVAGLASLVAVSGCRKKPVGGPPLSGDTNLPGNVLGPGGFTEGTLPGGRPPPGTAEIAGQFAPVYFEFDSAQVQSAERGKIETVGDYLKQNAGGGVIVEGNCDERGSREYNLALGERRAMAVRAYLVSLGVDGARIQTKSFGKEKPVALGHDEESWAKNRRADFVLFK